MTAIEKYSDLEKEAIHMIPGLQSMGKPYTKVQKVKDFMNKPVSEAFQGKPKTPLTQAKDKFKQESKLNPNMQSGKNDYFGQGQKQGKNDYFNQKSKGPKVDWKKEPIKDVKPTMGEKFDNFKRKVGIDWKKTKRDMHHIAEGTKNTGKAVGGGLSSVATATGNGAKAVGGGAMNIGKKFREGARNMSVMGDPARKELKAINKYTKQFSKKEAKLLDKIKDRHRRGKNVGGLVSELEDLRKTQKRNLKSGSKLNKKLDSHKNMAYAPIAGLGAMARWGAKKLGGGVRGVKDAKFDTGITSAYKKGRYGKKGLKEMEAAEAAKDVAPAASGFDNAVGSAVEFGKKHKTPLMIGGGVLGAGAIGHSMASNSGGGYDYSRN